MLYLGEGGKQDGSRKSFCSWNAIFKFSAAMLGWGKACSRGGLPHGKGLGSDMRVWNTTDRASYKLLESLRNP